MLWSIRARLSIAVAALVLAAGPLCAQAQSAKAEAGRLEPPTVIGASLANSDGDLAAPPGASSPIAVFKMPAEPVVRLPAADPNEAIPLPVPMDPNSGEKPDAGNSYKPSGKGKFGPIDQYPQNPRCYVAGHYVPAPPTCPN